MAKDPVCGMEVDEGTVLKITREGNDYYFCSEKCRDTFTGKKSAAPATQKVTVPISGMHCASCVKRIEEALGSVPGVERASVNFAAGTAAVQFHPEKAARKDLVAAVERAGYGVIGGEGGDGRAGRAD